MRAAGEVMRQRIVRGIQELTTRNNRPPTNRELGEYLGGKSTGHIDYHLRILREQGVLMHDPKKSRGIMLRAAIGRAEAASTPAAQPRMLRIPLRGRIAAGAPIEAIEDRDEYVDIASSVPRGEEVFALRVKGKSMIEDLIDDNDIVVVRAQQTAQDGDMVVALLTNGPSEAGEATLKRFYREKGGLIRLQPANVAMQPIMVSERDVQIQGKVISVIREV
ncbi:MAG TPA: transcriptional repressor LexA [Chloroflexota bacterium]|jgi:repressor LexA|nr:transcriptional repressor LexA [Chloroflexota bacterium]